MAQKTTLLTEMMDKAIIFSAEKMGFEGRDQVVEARAQGDCATCDYLRYGLAKEVANYLGITDKTIQVVFFFEPEGPILPSKRQGAASRLSPGISLILRVSRKTAALESLIASVISSIEEEYKRVHCPEAKALCNMIDIITVEDEEIERRTGYGALVGSLFMPPMEIWKRKM